MMSGKQFISRQIENDDGLVEYMVKNCLINGCADTWFTERNSNATIALPSCYGKNAEEIYNMEIRLDDVWIVSLPKCGTTWMQEMMWLLKNKCDFKTAKEVMLHHRFPFVEHTAIGSPIKDGKTSWERALDLNSPRFLKTHLSYNFLPHQMWTVKPKIIYTCRNPAAMALSYFHHFTIFKAYQGDLDHFLDSFLKDQTLYCPYWDHVLPFWKMRNEPNICFVFYEDMKDNLSAVMHKVAKFLEVEITPTQETDLLKHLSFTEMKNNPSVNFESVIKNFYQGDEQKSFIRSGQNDEWKSVMPQYKDRIEEWIRKNTKGTDFDKY